jgi:hypothetical protein
MFTDISAKHSATIVRVGKQAERGNSGKDKRKEARYLDQTKKKKKKEENCDRTQSP